MVNGGINWRLHWKPTGPSVGRGCERSVTRWYTEIDVTKLQYDVSGGIRCTWLHAASLGNAPNQFDALLAPVRTWLFIGLGMRW